MPTPGTPEDADYQRRMLEIRSPDCKDGKRRACVGDAWDVENDIPAECTCACHWETLTSAEGSWGVKIERTP